MSTTETTEETTVETKAVVDPTRASKASTRIAKMIVKSYAKEGDRNFEAGAETWAELVQRRTDFDKFTPNDFDRTIASITDDVRSQVSIDIKSIRLADWVSAHVLRSLVRDEIGELADKLDYYEYRALSCKEKASKKVRALVLDKKDVAARLNDGWLGFIQSIAEERATGGRIGSDEFSERLAAHEATLAELAASNDPAQALLQASLQAAKDKAKKIEGVNRKLTEAITSGLSEGVVTSDGITNMVGGLAKALKMPMPKLVGYDPSTVTIEELKIFVRLMFQFKRFDEARALHGMLAKVLENQDRMVAIAASNNETLKMSKVS